MAVGIRTELGSMSTSRLAVRSALLNERQPLSAPPYALRRSAIEHRWHLVKCFSGTAWPFNQRAATKGTFLMLAASYGTTETAWLSETGAYGHCACEMWALCRSNPLQSFQIEI